MDDTRETIGWTRPLDAVTEAKLLNAVAEFDRAESRKKCHNPYALARYAMGVSRVRLHVATGIELRQAIRGEFCGKLCDKLLKAVGLPVMSKHEALEYVNLPPLPGDEDDE